MPARPSRPPCTIGCRVLTRPSIISGKPVTSLTSRTGRPASRIALAVPPVDSSSMSRAARALRQVDQAGLVGNGQQRAADLTGEPGGGRRSSRRVRRKAANYKPGPAGASVRSRARRRYRRADQDSRLKPLLRKAGSRVRRARNPRSFLRSVARWMPSIDRGAALVAVAMVQHFGEQRDLQFAQRDLVQVLRLRSRRGLAGSGARNWRHVRAAADACARFGVPMGRSVRRRSSRSPASVPSDGVLQRVTAGRAGDGESSALLRQAPMPWRADRPVQRKSKVNATMPCTRFHDVHRQHRALAAGESCLAWARRRGTRAA